MTENKNRDIIEWNTKGQPISKLFDDVYFSTEHGLNESRYIFLKHNDLPGRWFKKSKNTQKSFTIFETGFGSGLNFLSTWQAWLNCKNQCEYRTLHFISVEKYPLSLEELKRASSLWPELKSIADQLIAQYPPQPAIGLHRLIFDSSAIKLTLFFGDVTDGLDELYVSFQKSGKKDVSFGEESLAIDAWYLDGFTPAKNPDMWKEELFQHMANLSEPANYSTFSTFTSASHVRKGLQKYGFCCKKTEGFGLKREMLFGSFKSTTKDNAIESHGEKGNTSAILGQKRDLAEESFKTIDKSNSISEKFSWLLQKNLVTSNKGYIEDDNNFDVTIIGGGISGCLSAFSLANRGLKVLLIEKNSDLATHASGNTQGLVYTRLSPHSDPLSDFNLKAQIFSDQFYRAYNLYTDCGDSTGIFHCAHNQKIETYYKEISERYKSGNRSVPTPKNRKNFPFALWVDKKDSESICGVPLAFGGLFLKRSGWIQPPILCKQLCKHENITVIYNTEITKVEQSSNTNKKRNTMHWSCFNLENQIIATTSKIVIANAIDAKNITQSSHLPLKSIRGQVSYIPANEASKNLKVPICGEGYIAPAITNHAGEKLHSIGASFNLFDKSLEVKQSDQDDNIEKLFKIAPSMKRHLVQDNDKYLRGRVSFRTTSPDYFPIVGPVPDEDKTFSTFSSLRKNAKTAVEQPGQYHRGLYCNLAMGSRGLAYAPLCSELLADLIVGDFLPIEKSLYKHLNPSRFLIRALQKNKSKPSDS